MTDRPAISPCPEHETACLAAAWGLEEDPVWDAHRQGCDRCRDAFEAARIRACLAVAPPPARVRVGLASAVFERTTRAPARTPGWGWAGAAFAAAGAAYLALRPEEMAPPDVDLSLAEMDLDLLEDLDLAENLDLLELLDALEDLEDA